MDTAFHKYMKHVEDLEEWNEEWNPTWDSPTITVNNVVTVTHGFTERDEFAPMPDETERRGTVVAVYKPDGKPVSLQIYGENKHADHGEHNYWGNPSPRRLQDLELTKVVVTVDENGRPWQIQLNGFGIGNVPPFEQWILCHVKTTTQLSFNQLRSID
jgi:hypothetical protein